MTDRNPHGPDAGASPETDLARHHESMRILAEVEQWLEHPPAHRQGWVAWLEKCLDPIGDTLRSYFEAEESGLLYEEVPVKFPRLSDKVEKLRAEHARILADLDDVMGQISSCKAAGSGDAADLLDHGRDLVAAIKRHELQETRLLQDAYWQEVGTGG